MGEHKTGNSNWSTEQKELYRQRREKGLRGQLGVVTVHKPIKDEEGNDQQLPIGTKSGGTLSRGKSSGLRSYRRHLQPVAVKRQRKATGRGE